MKMNKVYVQFQPVVLILGLCSGLLTGCGTINGPTIPKALDRNGLISTFSTNAFQANLKEYRDAMGRKTSYPRAQVLRDQMIGSIRVEIEMNYRIFEQQLYSGRATFNTAADITELALAGAATITHGEQAKTIIGAVLLATKGSRLSYDKNFFREKTTEAIIASMQSERSKKLAQIIDSMNLTVQAYPFEKAWVDLVDYFYAGTIEGGLLALTSEAGRGAAASKEKLQIVEASRIRLLKASAADIRATGDLTDELGKLVNAADQAAARDKALAILGRLKSDGVNVTFDSTDSNEQLYQKLQDQIDAATANPALKPKLIRAFAN